MNRMPEQDRSMAENLHSEAICSGTPDITRLFQKEPLTNVQNRQVREVRIWIVIFIVGLVLSGITAFPLETELHWLLFLLSTSAVRPIASGIHLLPWIARVSDGLTYTNRNYPFLAYGTDWLAFGHLVIATVFIGPYRDPVRNKWIIDFGLIACAGVIPLALIAGHAREIPFSWRLVDCSFGVFGALPLLRCKMLLRKIERADAAGLGSVPGRSAS